MQTLSRLGAFNTPERAGVYVGSLAGVIADNPDRAEDILARITPIPEADQWIIIRAIAYSGVPDWQELMRHFTLRIPRYKVLGDRYIGGKMATLTQFAVPPAPTSFERLKKSLHLDGAFGATPRKLTPGAEPGRARHAVGLLLRHRQLRAHPRHRRHAAAVGRSQRRRAAHHRQHGEIYARHQRDARPGPARHPEKHAQGARSSPRTQSNASMPSSTRRKRWTPHASAPRRMAAIEEVKSKGSAFKRTASWWSLYRAERDCRRLPRRGDAGPGRIRAALRRRRRHGVRGHELHQPTARNETRARAQ